MLSVKLSTCSVRAHITSDATFPKQRSVRKQGLALMDELYFLSAKLNCKINLFPTFIDN